MFSSVGLDFLQRGTYKDRSEGNVRLRTRRVALDIGRRIYATMGVGFRYVRHFCDGFLRTLYGFFQGVDQTCFEDDSILVFVHVVGRSYLQSSLS